MKIKPLEFRKTSGNSGGWIFVHGIRIYSLYNGPQGWWTRYDYEGEDQDVIGTFPTLEEAKAACQAHHEKTIRDLIAEWADMGEFKEALAQLLEVFDSDTARRMYTQVCGEGWAMLEIGTLADGRAALAKL